MLNDIEKSTTNFIDDACKSVVAHIGAVKLLSYLGQICASSLYFQTSMWQLILTESIFPVNMNREHLWWEAFTLYMFTELLPEVSPCAVPPSLLPPAPPVQAPVKVSASTTFNPDESGSIAKPDNPPDELHHVPLPQMSGMVQTPSISIVTPKVFTPQVSTPLMPVVQVLMPQTPATLTSMTQTSTAPTLMPLTSV